MPRTYRYDHFKVAPGHPIPADVTADKRHLEEVKSAPAPEEVHADTAIHYGHKFAETERMFKQKAESARATRRTAPAKDMSVSTEEPTSTPLQSAERVPGGFGALVSHARANVELLQHGLHEVRSAARGLMGLPMKAAQQALASWN